MCMVIVVVVIVIIVVVVVVVVVVIVVVVVVVVVITVVAVVEDVAPFLFRSFSRMCSAELKAHNLKDLYLRHICN
jgi:hypothetical protein